jgi:hypothetical protein
MRLRFLAILIIVAWRVAGATSPPIPKPLDERVKMASHIFVGVAEDIWIIDSKGRKVEPQPKGVDLDQAIEMSVRVNEVLYPDNWHTNTSIRVLYGGGFFGVSDARQEFVGKELIYLTAQSNVRPTDFVASYGWNLTETLDKRAGIEALITGRAKAQSK